jgi:predicted neuraminidase
MELPNPASVLIDRPYSYHETLLPSTTVQVHASNLLLLPNGDLLCAWFGGTLEGKPDICIYMSRRAAGTQAWSDPVQMTNDHHRSEQNPVLFRNPSSGELWLLYTSQELGNQDTSIIKCRVSTDREGKYWNKPRVLFSEQGTFIRQPMVVLDNGTWVLSIFKCRTSPGERWLGNDDISCVRASKDMGHSWTEEIQVPESYGCVHMEIQRLRSGQYVALFRSRWADHIYRATSPDGLTWSGPTATVLPNPNAGICFDILRSGRLILVYNHSSRAGVQRRREGLYDDIGQVDNRKNQKSIHGGKEAFWGAPRAPLCVAWSDDEGLSWNHRILEDGDGYCMTNNSQQRLNRELSYPSMVLGDDGTLHIAFTFWRQRIKYVEIKEDFFNL